MPLTKRKQDFAISFMKTKDIRAAAIVAGYKPCNSQDAGMKLLLDQDIQVFMAAEKLAGEKVTPETLTREFNEAIALARVYHQPGAMVGAIKSKAQLHGFLKDTVDHTGRIDHDHKHDVKVRKIDLDERKKMIIEGELGSALQ